MNDLISRQWLMECVEEGWIKFDTEKDKNKFIHLVRDTAPSAQPQRMRGRYIGTEYDGYADGCPVYYEWKCSVCGCTFEDEEPNYNFCPNCGARMDGGEQDEW